MCPAVAGKGGGDPVEVGRPDGEIEVGVRPRHGAHVEVDCPPTEEPRFDPFALEEPQGPTQTFQLCFLAHTAKFGKQSL